MEVKANSASNCEIGPRLKQEPIKSQDKMYTQQMDKKVTFRARSGGWGLPPSICSQIKKMSEFDPRWGISIFQQHLKLEKV